MIKEHDSFILTKDISGLQLQSGDMGIVVAIHEQANAFEVEFMTLEGQTIAVETLDSKDIRPVTSPMMPHIRGKAN